MLRIVAKAAVGSTGITGEWHALIAFVQAGSPADAERVAREALESGSWMFPEIQQVTPLNPDAANADGIPGAAKEVIADAAVGFSLIVFNDPILKQ